MPAARVLDNPGGKKFDLLRRNIYQGILKDDGHFSAIDPMKRAMVAENTYDLGEYLTILHRSGELKTDFGVDNLMTVIPITYYTRDKKVGFFDLRGGN